MCAAAVGLTVAHCLGAWPCYKPCMRFLNSGNLIRLGIGLYVVAFAYDLFFAGLPYPDPTPEMQQEWLFHKGIANRMMDVAVPMFLLGCAWKAVGWIVRS